MRLLGLILFGLVRSGWASCPDLEGYDDPTSFVHLTGTYFTELTATASGTADTMAVRVDGVDAGTPMVQLALYDGNYNHIANTAGIAINAGAGVYSAPLDRTVPITAGTDYIMGVTSQTDNSVRISTQGSDGIVRFSGQRFSSSYDTWPSGFPPSYHAGGDCVIVFIEACGTPTPTTSPTATATPTASATMTESSTPSATATPPTATASPTLTFTRTVGPPTGTATFTNTPVIPSVTATRTVNLSQSGLDAPAEEGKASLGPVPAKRGELVCLASNSVTFSGSATIYNFGGQVVCAAGFVRVMGFGSIESACFDSSDFAPGVYLARLAVVLGDGSSVEHWQKLVILP